MAVARALSEAFIRFRPDFATFRSDADAGLKKSTAGLETNVPVNADTTASKAKLDELRAKMTDLAADITKSRALKVDDKQLTAAFARAGLQADRLEAKLKMDLSVRGTDKAEVELLALDATADRLKKKLADLSPGGFKGLLNKLPGVSLGGGGGGAGTGGLSAISDALSSPQAIIAAVTVGLAALPFAAQAAAGGIVTALGGGLAAIGVIGALQTKGVQRDLTDLENTAKGAFPAITKPFDSVVGSILQTATKIVPTFLGSIGTALQTIAGPLKTFGDTLVGTFAQPAVSQSIKAVAGAFAGILKALAPTLPGLVKGIAEGITRIANDIKDNPRAFSDFIVFLTQIVGAALQVLNGLTQAATYLERHFVPAFIDAAKQVNSKFVSPLTSFFTVDIPGSVTLMRELVKGVFDKLELDAVEVVAAIVGAFALLPGPLGAPFRAAHTAIDKELDKLKIQVAIDTGDIQNTLDKLHGHDVTLDFGLGLPGGVSIPGARTGQRTAPIPGHAAGTGGAAPGWALVGERGPELVSMHGGETVIPHGASMKLLNGYAAGTDGWDVTGMFTPSVGTFDRELTATFNATEQAIVNAVNRTAQLSLGAGGFGAAPAGSGPYQAYARSLFPRFGWGGDQWAPFNAIVMEESGWNPTIQNPTSTAYGIGQFLDTTWATVGATKTSNPYLQIFDMEEYIKSRYGNPASAQAFHLAHNSYAHGTTNADRVARALSIVRSRRGLPAKYNSAEIELESWMGRVATDRKLVQAGAHHVGLEKDLRHVHQLQRLIAPWSHDRRAVRVAEGILSGREKRLPGEISAATSRGMRGLAGRLRGRLSNAKDLDKQFAGWLGELGPRYTAKDRRQDTRFADSIINADIKRLGLPPAASYDSGGWLPRGLSLAYNGTGKPEPVGGPQTIKLVVDTKGGRGTDLDRAIVAIIQRHVYVAGGGSAEVALGRAT